MTKTTEIVVTQGQGQEQEQEPPKQPTNLFSFFPKFNLQLPFLNPPKVEEKAKPDNVVVGGGDQGKEKEGSKPTLVWFPKTQVAVPPPLETEAQESNNNKTSNPLILWQVYVLGGIIISRWIWARWNERKARGRSPNDDKADGRHSDEGRSSDNE